MGTHKKRLLQGLNGKNAASWWGQKFVFSGTAQVLVVLVLSFFLWCFLFRDYIAGHCPLPIDAQAYFQHIHFYLENIARGVYPLWSPQDSFLGNDFGLTNEFFLRRIGEFNPLYGMLLLLTGVGMDFFVAYCVFMTAYYFLGVCGFFLLCRRLFTGKLLPLLAVLFLLFSSLGHKAFESYLLLIIVPAIWFFYFLLGFMEEFRKRFLLGAVFSLMIINTTYIPLYFYTFLFFFGVCTAALYWQDAGAALKRAWHFVQEQPQFALGCCGALLLSCIPALAWFWNSRVGDVLIPARYAGDAAGSSMVVSLQQVNEGGLLPHFIFNRLFVDLEQLRLDDVYIPLFMILTAMSCIWTAVSRRMVFFFVLWLVVFLFGIADASFIHPFLYRLMPIFRYFRNLQFFIWLALLPIAVIFVVEQAAAFFKELPKKRFPRIWLSLWVSAVHVAMLVFFLEQEVSTYSSYAVLFLSVVFFMAKIWGLGNRRVLAGILWLAIVIQPCEVFQRLDRQQVPGNGPAYTFTTQPALSLLSRQEAQVLLEKPKGPLPSAATPYFSTKWIYTALERIHHAVLWRYGQAKFLICDRVAAAHGLSSDFSAISKAMITFENVAYVSDATSLPLDLRHEVAPQASIPFDGAPDFKILKADVNTMLLKVHFDAPKFLVRTTNYHAGWQAFIDGKKTEIVRTNVTFQGIFIPAGEHMVLFRFYTPWRYVMAYGLIALFAGIFGWLIWLICSRK
ncbi:MAG: YfhO family protein [Candidatus Omnitrophica bacterium]|nr:YfhO family protein [Candidatus Omnitrophota bacterium]